MEVLTDVSPRSIPLLWCTCQSNRPRCGAYQGARTGGELLILITGSAKLICVQVVKELEGEVVSTGKLGDDKDKAATSKI